MVPTARPQLSLSGNRWMASVRRKAKSKTLLISSRLYYITAMSTRQSTSSRRVVAIIARSVGRRRHSHANPARRYGRCSPRIGASGATASAMGALEGSANVVRDYTSPRSAACLPGAASTSKRRQAKSPDVSVTTKLACGVLGRDLSCAPTESLSHAARPQPLPQTLPSRSTDGRPASQFRSPCRPARSPVLPILHSEPTARPPGPGVR
jgi:hypothetical protein